MNVTIRRLGVIGDLHAEHLRLGRVLDWFQTMKVDALVCTGDVADGSGCINACCELLCQAGVITVAGNHDRWLLQDRVRHVPDAHHLDDLTSSTLEYLTALPATRTLETMGGPLLLCHGVGANDLAKVWPGTQRTAVMRSREMDRLLRDKCCRFVVNGHLHYRVLIDFPELLLVNAGTLKGPNAGVAIMDFPGNGVAAYAVDESSVPRLVAEHPLSPDSGRRVWQDTRAFDGSWEPCTLHA